MGASGYAHIARNFRDRGLIGRRRMQTGLSMRHFLIVPVLACLALAQPVCAEETPPVVVVQTTEHGPVYANSQGLTLYIRQEERATPNKSGCDNVVQTQGNSQGQMLYVLPANEKRKTCAQKTPPFVASVDAKPVGKWTFFARTDGQRQWAYNGRAVYTSVRDLRPGDVNDKMEPLKAPIGLPAIFSLKRKPEGLVVVLADSAARRTADLYVNSKLPAGRLCEGSCEAGWEPLVAPAAIVLPTKSDISVKRRTDGRFQWLFRGRPLYQPSDVDASGALAYASFTAEDGLSDSAWQRPSYSKATRLPDTVKMVWTPLGRVYATSDGMSLYTYSCREEAPGFPSCDQPGDAAAHLASLCGSGTDCANKWRPYLAASEAKSAGEWTVMDVSNPPFLERTGQLGEGVPTVRAWAYRGRPVYTYYEDQKPGDYNGDHIIGPFTTSFNAVRVPGDNPLVRQ